VQPLRADPAPAIWARHFPEVFRNRLGIARTHVEVAHARVSPAIGRGRISPYAQQVYVILHRRLDQEVLRGEQLRSANEEIATFCQ